MIMQLLQGRRVLRYSQLTAGDLQALADAEVLIIDCFGLLSSIYKYGDVAYVGGGFGAGIHNLPRGGSVEPSRHLRTKQPQIPGSTRAQGMPGRLRDHRLRQLRSSHGPLHLRPRLPPHRLRRSRQLRPEPVRRHRKTPPTPPSIQKITTTLTPRNVLYLPLSPSNS